MGGAQAPPILRVCNYGKNYGSTRAAIDISLEVHVGELHGLLGANGSGKSSLIHGITGVSTHDVGEIEVCGEPGSSREAKRKFAYVPDDLPLPESLSGNEFLDYHDRLRQSQYLGWRDSLIGMFALEPHLGKFLGEMSQGTKKKLQITAAMSALARLIILDEPYRGLDAQSCQTLMSLLQSHCRRGGAALLATHDLEMADRECTNVTILRDGRIAAAGTPSDLRKKHQRNSLGSVFLRLSDLEERGRQTALQIENDMPVVTWRRP